MNTKKDLTLFVIACIIGGALSIFVGVMFALISGDLFHFSQWEQIGVGVVITALASWYSLPRYSDFLD